MAKTNRNVVAVYALVVLLGLGDSIWAASLLPAWLFILSNKNNEQVGIVEAAGSIASLITALPVGWLADKYGKARVCWAGAVMMQIGAASTIFLIYNPLNWDDTYLYKAFIAGQMILGVASGICSGPAQALFADSVERGSRSHAYLYLQLFYMVPSICGPILSIILFHYYGDDWSFDQMRPVFLLGICFEFPGSICMFFLSDKLALEEDEGESDEEGDEDNTDNLLKKNSIDGVFKKKEYSLRIPLTMFFGELVIAIGAGMTVKYGALFFKQDILLSPSGVQCVYIGQMLSISLFSIFAVKLGTLLGRIQASFIVRIIGLTCLGSMSMLVINGVRFWYYIAPLYCLRSGLMNCTYPLDESVVMDYVPKNQRAKWKALESIGSVGWSGSAVLGGFLADQYDYSTTFLITAAFQLCGAFIHLTMVGVVPKEKAKRKSTLSGTNGELLKEPLLTQNVESSAGVDFTPVVVQS